MFIELNTLNRYTIVYCLLTTLMVFPEKRNIFINTTLTAYYFLNENVASLYGNII